MVNVCYLFQGNLAAVIAALASMGFEPTNSGLGALISVLPKATTAVSPWLSVDAAPYSLEATAISERSRSLTFECLRGFTPAPLLQVSNSQRKRLASDSSPSSNPDAPEEVARLLEAGYTVFPFLHV